MIDADYEPAIDFLTQFFANTSHAVEIRSLPQEPGAGPNRPRFSRDSDIIIDHCKKWDQPGRAVYFGCCTRITGRPTGSRADCAELPALWVDIDCAKQSFTKEDACHAALSLPIRPSLLVDSGGGIHCYWLLREALSVRADADGADDTEREVVAVLRQLAGVLAGDPAVCDLARVMRLPGTHNSKYDLVDSDGIITGKQLLPVFLLPESDFSLRYELGDIVKAFDVKPPTPRVEHPVATGPIPEAYVRKAVEGELGRILSATEGSRNHTLNRAAFALGQFVGAHALNRGDARTKLAAAARAVGLPDAEASATIASGLGDGEQEPRSVPVSDYATQQLRSTLRPSAEIVQLRSVDSAAPKPDTVSDGVVRNDRGNARLLIEDHGDAMRYVLGIGWHIWDGRRYCHDPEQVEIARLAHQVHERLLSEADGDEKRFKWAVQAGNSARLKNMAHEARSYVYSEHTKLDADALLLNCLNGTLSLRTGALRNHMQSDLITKLVPIDYDERAACPVWEAFLLSIFGGDADLVDFLQRCIGYSLTGDCREQVIFILHGLGSNGKSVLVETLSALIGDYGKHCPSDTFLSKQVGGIPNDVAMLVGARFVSVVETEHGRGLAEGLVKQATGGDAMTVRFLHKEFFSFIPKFKLWLATNHKPVIRGSDLAIWRRIRLLPFNETFVDADKAAEGQQVKDLELRAKLIDELPGILAWAVRGCFEWQARGLVVPGAVEKATRLYQESQNPVSKFIADVCWVDKTCFGEAGALYEAYKFWCEQLDEDFIGKKRFGTTLDECGFPPYKGGGGVRQRQGIDIQEPYKKEIAAAAEAAKLAKAILDATKG